MSKPDAKVVQLFAGDQRCQRLCDAILDTIYERGAGLPVPLILGVLRLVEHSIIAEDHEG